MTFRTWLATRFIKFGYRLFWQFNNVQNKHHGLTSWPSYSNTLEYSLFPVKVERIK